jgi:mannose-6-phosphate isomerase-like protein (cupin superfamily)
MSSFRYFLKIAGAKQMKAIYLLAIFCAITFVTHAQVAAPSAPPAGGGRGGVPAAGSNETVGVDIDRFIGYPEDHTVHLSHGTLLTHSILRAGNPYQPGAQGAVLEYRKELVTATLLPNSRTPISTLPDEYFFYVKSGTGRLDDGKQSWDLREGIAILAPPNVPHRFINTSDKPLSMIMLSWTGGPNVHDQLIVRDVNLIPWCEENAHWNNTSRCVFSAADGLIQGERIYLVMLQPWAVSQPHNHTPGTEEIWTKVTPGVATILLGSELREMPEDSAYLVPPNGITDHSNLNLSKDRVEWWIYVARGPAQGAGRGGTGAGANGAAPPAGGGGGRGPANPNLSRDMGEATVPGKPLN